LPASRGATRAFERDAAQGGLGTMRAVQIEAAQPVLAGRLCPLRGRALRVVGEGRICAETQCNTRLSRHNPSDRCYRHQARSFPRVRGRPLLEEPVRAVP